MTKGTEGSMETLWRAEQLMKEGKADEALPLVESLEKEKKLPPDARLTYQLLQSQLLIIAGDYGASQQLAAQLRQRSLDQGKVLQAVDASIVMAEALVEGGHYERGAKAIAEGEQMLTTVTNEASDAFAQRRASFIYLRGRICLYKADLEQAMEYFQQTLAMRQELGNKHEIAESLRNIGVIHSYKGDLEQAIKFTQQALQLFQEVSNKHHTAWCLTNLGAYHQGKGEFDRALEYCQQGLALFQELGNRNMIAYSLNMLGAFYFAKGELNQALEYNQQRQSLVEDLGNKWAMGDCFADFGWIYWHRGEVELALENFQQYVAIGQEIGNKQFIANGFGVIGIIHWQKGALDQALAHLEEGMSCYEEQGLNIAVGFYLYWMILVFLDKGSLEQAQQYLERLQDINEQEDHKGLSQVSRLAQALVLKASPRIRDKGRAQELFQQLIDEDMVHFVVTQGAMVSLCELLLDELKAYGELSVFQEASSLVDKLYSLAQNRQSFSLIITSLILKAKFAMIEGDLAIAAQYLEQARVTAEEKGLERLAEKVTGERDQLEMQFETWEQLIQRNAPFRERVEHARIIDYLKKAEKLVTRQNLEIPS
ncbi:MAG: tetratricopeptide repeat protein [Candidatus Thorarchaeota archaeon]